MGYFQNIILFKQHKNANFSVLTFKIQIIEENLKKYSIIDLFFKNYPLHLKHVNRSLLIFYLFLLLFSSSRSNRSCLLSGKKIKKYKPKKSPIRQSRALFI
ncbi:hypothetical protein EF405_10650 [Cyclobacteriaceae bacterium YHN15]|nr:hypothetical protein EF405_10650 [Cyclobacteriaceae bacterium YHN15]